MADKRSNAVPCHLTDHQLRGLDEGCAEAVARSAPGAKVTRSGYIAALLDADIAARHARTAGTAPAQPAPPKAKGAR